jgi:hypothetical protein
MSHSNNNNSIKLNNNKSSYKTFCKVCQDAGKTEKEYTNHNVRDLKDGRTTCPTLLALECKNCFKRGHTVKYCSLTKTYTEPINKKAYQEPAKTQQKSKNVFMLLDSDNESDSEEVVEEKEQLKQFPVLQQQQPQQAKAQPLNYSRLINLTEEQIKKEEVIKALPKATVALPKATVFLPKVVQRGKLDWATAESDSEGDEEEEDYYPVSKQQQQDDLSAW